MSVKHLTTMMILVAAAACGGDGDARSDARPESSSPRASVPASGEDESDVDLCGRIDDDEALTPAGAEPLQNPGVEAANSPRRCMSLFGVDMPIDSLRAYYRSTLDELGYEVTDYQEGDGIAEGNLSRTFLRAARSGMRVNVQIDEFDPAATTLARHAANVKLQIDAMND